MGKYADELKRAMDWLGQKEDTFFLGQSVVDAGTGMTNSLKDIDVSKRLETPVFEETQMGMTVGMALNGTVPVSIFPRWNFLLLATNQIVNHLDKIPLMSDFKSKVIVRTSIGSERPFHPYHQHVGDFSEAFRLMCPNIEIVVVNEPEDIFPAYQKAYERTDVKSTIVVEYGDYLGEK